MKDTSTMAASLCLIIAIIGSVCAQAPDNRGTDFIVGYMANYALGSDCELFVTTSRTTTVYVTVTAPRYTSVSLNENFAITAGEVKQIKISNRIRAAGTELSSKGVWVTATDEVVVYGTINEAYSNDAFLAFPLDVLGDEYYALTYYPSGSECELLIIAIEDNTVVSLKYGPHSSLSVTYSGTTYRAGNTQTITMQKYDTYQAQSMGDLTGTYITATKVFTLMSGNELTNVNPYGTSGAHDVLVDQILPIKTWGKEFAIIPTPERTVGDVIKFLGSEDGTTAELLCSGGYSQSFSVNAGTYAQYTTPSDQVCHCKATKAILVTLFVISQLSYNEPADPALITIPPIEQYAADYSFATPKYSRGSYRNFFMFIVKKTEKNGLKINGAAFPSSTTYTDIPNTAYVGGYIEVAEGTHTVRHDVSISVFGGFMYGSAYAESYGMTTGMRLAPINTICIPSTTVTGDGLDNDCDGLIDEEDCIATSPIDDDGDGAVDEDCAKPTPIHGNWGAWAAWTTTCYCSGTYASQQPRYRVCDNPEPQYDGNQCANSNTDYRACTATSSCPVDGGYTQWTSWTSCSVTCGTGTLERTRTCTNPAPANNGADCDILGVAINSKNCYTGLVCPDPCASNPCKNSASCTSGSGTYTCTCTAGWTGSNCNTDIDECASNPCNNGASCVNGQNGYTCSCTGGWTGTTCDTDVNECSSNPCQNGASCTNGRNQFSCTCTGGWTGVDCNTDINECSSSPCANGATCNNGQNQYTCTCAGGWTGTLCDTDVDECSSSPCVNGATCNNGANLYTCTCAGGWTGTTCDTDINECASNPCQNGGSCTNGQNRFTCSCAPGWTGHDCGTDIDECASNPCNNGASCINGQNSYTCVCTGGWTGTTCDTDVNECSSNPCQNGASCTNGRNQFTCTCTGGWTGVDCNTDIDECSSSPCANGATCNNGQNQYTCTCAGGWTGTLCDTDIDECASNPCQYGGTCTNEQNRFTCACTSGWTGADCSVDFDECSSSPCVNGATCNNGANMYTCTCAGGWTGTTCDTDIDECASNPCQNGGNCTNGQNRFTCSCASGWIGHDCGTDYDECSSNPCYNNATCNNGRDEYTCTCAKGWSGTDCDIPNRDGEWGQWEAWSACTKTCGSGRQMRVRYCDDPTPLNGLPCSGNGMEILECNTVACTGNGTGGSLNGLSTNTCPTDYFPCKAGSIVCVPSAYRCDCSDDCADGSDEQTAWAVCSSNLQTLCGNGASGLHQSFTIWSLMAAVVAMVLSPV